MQDRASNGSGWRCDVRSLVLLPLGMVFASAVLLASACENKVTGGGGFGANAPDCDPVDSCNDSACPSSLPAATTACADSGLICWYEDGPCALALGCTEVYAPCPSGSPCDPMLVWVDADSACSPPAVPCESAANGDVCAFPGEACMTGDECDYEYTQCGTDHHWVVSYSYGDCCDYCCDDECCGAVPACPSSVPNNGDYCDPCFDGPSCTFTVDPGCGPQQVTAECDTLNYRWVVSPVSCGGGGSGAAGGEGGSGQGGGGSPPSSGGAGGI
jgi:hypothetical protein